MRLHLARKLHAPAHADVVHQAGQGKAVLRGVAVAAGTPQLDAAACFPDLILKAVDFHRAADDLRLFALHFQRHGLGVLAIGVILVGTCPGGTSSNVMTYLSKGDVALSVGMTAVSTVLAPFLTPLLTLLYAGQRVDVNPVNMFLSIVKVVLVPIALGFVVNHFFHAFTQNAVRVLPLISTTAIVLIICAVVSANSAKIMTSGLLILAVVILHNLLGYLTGFGVGKLLKLDSTKCRAISIEVGMQNSGLATSLAAAHFAQYPLATIPGAVFSVWHNISGAVLANFFARTAEKRD